MTLKVDVSRLPEPGTPSFEMVERKGIGHPDTLCDTLAEHLSNALSQFYLERFGMILHHNVDKVLLRGGVSRPRFGGGSVVEPIEIYLAGRATRCFKGVDVPVETLAMECSRDVLKRTFHALDAERHVKIHCLVRPGSDDLVDLFARQQRAGGVWLANDSSIGVGYAPLSPLERNVLALDERVAAAARQTRPAFGEDLKLLAMRRGRDKFVTVACAICDHYVRDLPAYLGEKRHLAAMAAEVFGRDAEVTVNAADDPDAGSVYLTVTGTSAEAGDDGQTGRGNRLNGLITPGRPMTMESVAGKNPVSHVGKLYNYAARSIAEAAVSRIEGVAAAECYLASRIGTPVAEPRLAHVRLTTPDGKLPRASRVDEIVRETLASLDSLWRSLLGSTSLWPNTLNPGITETRPA